MHTEVLLRWIIDGGAQLSRFREKERIVNQAIIPLLANGAVRERASDYLVSKRRGSEVWLSIYADVDRADEVVAAVESYLYEFPWEHERLTSGDPLLEPTGHAYRHRLREVTDVALDLHGDQNLVEHQMFLIQIACGTDENIRDLHDFLCQYSPSYAGFPEHHKVEFWSALTEPGPDESLPVPIQAFWNIVLGCEPAPGGNPAAVADMIGIA